MSSELPDEPVSNPDQAQTIRIEEEMEQSYIDYAMSVIAGRALPDVRDGLKPVQKRILYAMEESGITSNTGHRKCSNIVGDTMGKYHPHGDSSIYDALARMAQEFSLRYPLVDGQGNFGSVDGDPPAAMRYTEARMSPLGEEMLTDIDSDTVDFQPNYDDRLEEPIVLPSALPNLLLNGSSGIAVGMSTNIPPHNLGEVIDGLIHRIDNPDCAISELIEHVKGPDFPTGANIVGRSGIYDAYTTGRGKVRLRADMEVDEEQGQIVVTELPYQENKARRIKRIADDVNDGTIEGIRDIRDESDRDGVRVVIELKRGANPDVVKNQLVKHHLERTFSIIMLALVDGQPRILNLQEMLDAFLEHRREVVRRRIQHELDNATERAHVLEGRLLALDNAEEVVELIRDASDRSKAKAMLRSTFDFSERQADHIVRMQLGSLTSLETEEIESEYASLTDQIERYETILSEESELLGVIKSELRDLKAQYDDDRRTAIIEDAGTVSHEDLIPQEESIVVLTESNYVKRMALSTFDAQHRGGKGIIGTKLKDGDRVNAVFHANTHDYLLCFTTEGQVYQLKTYEIPEMSRTARGKSAVNVLDLDPDEDVTAIVNTEEFNGDQSLTMVTKNGYIKRTPTTEFGNILSTGIRAVSLEPDDELVDVVVTNGTADVLIGTEQGRSIRFSEGDVRPMGRSARGVNGIELVDDDRVAGLVAVSDADTTLLTITEHGYGKRTPIEEYRAQSRYGKGLVDIKTTSRNGSVVALEAVSDEDDLILMSDDGQIMRTHAKEVSCQGRNTMGVQVMNPDESDRVTTIDVVPCE
ncbi:DNA gyrase subunit A [Halocatena pleomorpha]|uniref:DNA gyrase subunit A n=1 Tax=Halocatena pleomorpha TaxID=1785090 RepID=A0A3P3RE74_9EURY|nr:DNA gyrase subunit A [Halocatena pleomorpha]RRJ31040.1 DNA gyrase subunit A [Halocatena pleomorpha]